MLPPRRRRVRLVPLGCPTVLTLVAALSLLGGARPAFASAGAYAWPLAPPPPVLRGFEAPSSEWGPGHRGADLGAAAGAPVLAAGAGTVAFAAMLAGRGVVVVAHPDGLRTTYEPVTASVRVGSPVARGDLLGRLALAGSHCLPRACLHWGALRDGRYVDPLTLLGLAAGPVRLLPMAPALPGGFAKVPAPLPIAVGAAGIAPVAGGAAVVGPAPGGGAGAARFSGGSGSRRPGRTGVPTSAWPPVPAVAGLVLVAAGGVLAAGTTRRTRRRRAPPGQTSAGRSRASRS